MSRSDGTPQMSGKVISDAGDGDDCCGVDDVDADLEQMLQEHRAGRGKDDDGDAGDDDESDGVEGERRGRLLFGWTGLDGVRRPDAAD